MFAASDLVDIAKERFGESVLRERMRGASGVDQNAIDAAADLELTKIATSVISRVQAACVQVGWPLPGSWPAGSVDYDGSTDISGTLYADRWPDNLLQVALDLFQWRTLSGNEGISDAMRQVGKAAEAFFVGVQSGAISLGIGGKTDTATPEPVAARDRCGKSLVAGVPDRTNVLDTFRGFGWDRFH